MAYFSRNGFTPANGSIAKSEIEYPPTDAEDIVTVKDVKYSTLNGSENGKEYNNAIAIENEFEKVKVYAKCLFRNLLHLSRHQHVEREILFEFTATWSQLTRWHPFQRSVSQFPYYSLVLELEQKLNALVKMHWKSDLIEILLSQNINDQLTDSLNGMEQIRNIKFNDIRFDNR